MAADLATPNDAPVRIDPMALIAHAVKEKLPESYLKTLFELHNRVTRDDAERAYAAAVARFQSECPPIVKNRTVTNKAGALLYRYENYDDLMTLVGPVLNRCGMTVSFSTEPAEQEGHTAMVCRLRVGIHVEEFRFACPVPQEMAANLTDPQVYGVWLSYLKRYALRCALNIRVVGEDVDGQPANRTITEEQVAKLTEAMGTIAIFSKRSPEVIATNVNQFCRQFQAASGNLADIPAREYDRALAELRRLYQKQAARKPQKAGAR